MYDFRNNLTMLYDFYIVAKEMSFSKAAEKNYISQPSLSRSVKNLEEELKLKLVNSNNKGIKLTNDGDKLFKQLDEMFNGFEDYKYDPSKKPEDIKGKIKIGTTRTIADNYLPKYLAKFKKRYPNVIIEMLTDNGTVLDNYLTNHQIDLSIYYLPYTNYSDKYEIDVISIGNFKTYFACSREFYKKNSKMISTINDLKQFDLVISGPSIRRQFLDETLQLYNIKLNPTALMPDSKMMAEFVITTDYIGYFIEDEIETYNLVKLDLDIELPINTFGIIYPKNTISEIGKKFIELVLEDSTE